MSKQPDWIGVYETEQATRIKTYETRQAARHKLFAAYLALSEAASMLEILDSMVAGKIRSLQVSVKDLANKEL